MVIDGRPVRASGSIVIGGDEKGQLTLPFGTLSIVFRHGDTPKLQMSANPHQIIFTSNDNTPGMAGTFDLPTVDGNAHIVVTLQTIGSGANATHIIHYTVS